MARTEEKILPTDTGTSLHDRLAELGGDVLHDVLADYLEGKITAEEQDHALATSCKTLSREDGKLDFTKTAEELERLIRAYTPWPGTWMEWEGKRVKIQKVQIGPEVENQIPERIFMHEHKALLSCAGTTTLELLRVLPEGKKEMNGNDYVK